MIIKILYLILLTTVNSFLINPYGLKRFTTNSKQMLHQTFNDNDNDYFYFDPNKNNNNTNIEPKQPLGIRVIIGSGNVDDYLNSINQ